MSRAEQNQKVRDASNIRDRMASIRDDIDQDMDGIVEGARSLVDWREHVRSNPLIAAGLTALIGYAVVPKKQSVIQADPAQLSKMLKANKVIVSPGGNVKPKSSMMGGLIGTLLATAVRAAAVQAGQQLTAKVSGIQPSDPAAPPQPTYDS